MHPDIIYLLVACIGFAILGYYLGFYRPTEPFEWYSQAMFFGMTFLLIPMLTWVLWYQAGAINRLTQTGITPHPTIEYSVGVTSGQGKNPTWVFETLPNTKVNLDYYTQESNRKGWAIKHINETMVILSNDELTMS